jgi:hypothetical protein
MYLPIVLRPLPLLLQRLRAALAVYHNGRGMRDSH